MGNALQRGYMPALVALYRRLEKRIPAYTMRPGCRAEVAAYCGERGYRRVMVVTDATIRGLGLADAMLAGFEREGVECLVFDGVMPNPLDTLCQEARERGLEFRADAVAAIGGGSVLDAAKIIASGIAQPNTSVGALCTTLVPRKTLPHVAVPTTAGTGAEVSMGAVITEARTHRKRTGGSPLFVYDHVFLDAETTVGLPSAPTAAFGIDALSHAVESSLSRIGDRQGRAYAVEALRMIFENLPRVCEDGADLQAREKMLHAAMLAGIAMNVNYAGMAHPFAHALGGRYDLPHGDMIAATLVPALRFEQDVCEDQLAQLCVACGFGALGEKPSVLAGRFVDEVERLRDSLGLPGTVPALAEADIPALAKAAFADMALFPIPKYVTDAQAVDFLRGLMA